MVTCKKVHFAGDANVSVRPLGESAFGTRAEIKNLNSFRFIDRAIHYEVARQIEVIENGGKVALETRLFDAHKNVTRSMRSKEEANDYRYFPDPDLLPVKIEPELIATIKKTLPELPAQKCARFVGDYGLSVYDASVLTSTRDLADYFEKVAIIATGPKLAANWVTTELLGILNKNNLTIEQSPISAEALGTLVKRIVDNTISGKIAKSIFETPMGNPNRCRCAH